MKEHSLHLSKIIFTCLCLGVSFHATSQVVLNPISVADPSFAATNSASSDSYDPVLSTDGRFVAFASAANNLVLNGTNLMPVLSPPKLNVYVRDRANASTVLVTPATNGFGGGNADSFPTSITGDGRFVLVESHAINLSANVHGNFDNIYLHDTTSNTTSLVSINTNGIGGTGNSSDSVMSADARFIAFTSTAADLVTGDANRVADVFIRDTQSGTIKLVSATLGQVSGSGPSTTPDISPDGHYVVFFSKATNLVSGGLAAGDIYIRNINAQVTTIASTAAHVLLGDATGQNSQLFGYSISEDGQYVVYQANGPTNRLILRYGLQTGNTDVIATNASSVEIGAEPSARCLDISRDGMTVAYIGQTNSSTAIFVWNGFDGTITLVSGDTNGSVSSSGVICDSPASDANGRFISFLCNGTGLVTNQVISGFHLYVWDSKMGVTRLVDADTNGAGSISLPTAIPRISTNGNVIAFESLDGSLVPNFNNRSYDVFVNDFTQQKTELISTACGVGNIVSANGNSEISLNSTSADGRYVAFVSAANNLSSAVVDTKGFSDVYVRDVVVGTNILVSVSASNGSANGISTDPSISADGRFIAFSSTASNLVNTTMYISSNVYVRDLLLNSNTLVSVRPDSTGSGDGSSYSPIISADGRDVLFNSRASTLASGISSTTCDNLYWRDLSLGVTRLFATNISATTLTVGSMSTNGQFVAVGGVSSYLYVWDTQLNRKIYTNQTVSTVAYLKLSPSGNRLAACGSSGQIYAIDRTLNTSVPIGALPTPSVGPRLGMRFSGDNNVLAYVSAGANRTNQVFAYNFTTKSSNLVSHAFNSTAGANAGSDSVDISPDGRFVAFRSSSTNILPGVASGTPAVYIYDLASGETTLAAVSSYGNLPAAGRTFNPVFTADGNSLLFESSASDLVAGDANAWPDIFSLTLFPGGQPLTVFNLMVSGPVSGSSFPILSWPAVSGRTYQVQYKTSLSDATWQIITGGVTILGNQAHLTDTAFSGQRFYRVVAN